MARFLIDTNHLRVALRPVSEFRARLQRLNARGLRFRTSIPVLCEVEVSIQQSPKQDRIYRVMKRVLDFARIWPLDPELARIFAQTWLELRDKSRALSHVDITLAALARQYQATILTTDRDFEALPDIRTENWLEKP